MRLAKPDSEKQQAQAARGSESATVVIQAGLGVKDLVRHNK